MVADITDVTDQLEHVAVSVATPMNEDGDEDIRGRAFLLASTAMAAAASSSSASSARSRVTYRAGVETSDADQIAPSPAVWIRCDRRDGGDGTCCVSSDALSSPHTHQLAVLAHDAAHEAAAMQALQAGFTALGKFAGGMTAAKVMEISQSLPPHEMFESGRASTDPAFLAWKVAQSIESTIPRTSFHSGTVSSKIQDVVHSFTWAIPDPWSVAAMVNRSKHIIDLGAGSGYLAMRLMEAGAEQVTCVDDGSDKEMAQSMNPFHPIVKEGCVAWCRRNSKAIDTEKGGMALLFSWPRSKTAMEQCLCFFPDVAYVYEIGDGGSVTASLSSWMAAHAANWRLDTRLPVPNWRGERTCLTIYARIINTLPAAVSSLSSSSSSSPASASSSSASTSSAACAAAAEVVAGVPAKKMQAVQCQCVYAQQMQHPCTARATIKKKKSGLNFCDDCRQLPCSHARSMISDTLGVKCQCPTGQPCDRTPLMTVDGMPMVAIQCDSCRTGVCEHTTSS